MIRGIHATLYGQLTESAPPLEDIQAAFEARYADEPFVDVMPLGSHPETRFVKGANMCRLPCISPVARTSSWCCR